LNVEALFHVRASDRGMTGDTTASWLRKFGRFPEVWVALVASLCFVLFPEQLSFATSILVTAIFVMSLDLVLGYAGAVTLGHALFFGFGAYAAGLISIYGWNEPISVAVAAAAVGAIVALATGPFVLRLRELPLLMVTLALGAIAFEAANKATWLTGGDDGLVGIEFKPVLGVFEWTLSSDTAYFHALCWLCVCLYLARRVVNSPFGLAVVGVRENFRRMALLGAPVQSHLLRIYVIGGAMAALAGALSVESARFVGLSVLSVETSIAALVMLVVGGVGRLYGALLGTVAYMLVHHVAAQINPYHWMFVIGAMLVAVVLYARGGLLGLAETLAASVTRKRGAR
jgi:branched-chain amino acid transport system permease protein